MVQLMTPNHDLWHIQSAEQPAILMFKTHWWSFWVQHITFRRSKATERNGLTMIHSKRLTSPMGQIIFLTMILPSFMSTNALQEARPATRYVLIALVLIYMALTTVGWVRILNSQLVSSSPAILRAGSEPGDDYQPGSRIGLG